MSHDKIGPKEQALREMRQHRFARKPSHTELKGKIAKIKPSPRIKNRRGR